MAYNRCLASQLKDLNETLTAPDLSGVSSDKRMSIAENHDIARIRQAAEQGHAKAQYSLGRICRDGEGVLQDYVKPMRG